MLSLRPWFGVSLFLALFVSAPPAAIAQDFQRTPLAADHPFVGNWRIELPQHGCFAIAFHLRELDTQNLHRSLCPEKEQ